VRGFRHGLQIGVAFVSSDDGDSWLPAGKALEWVAGCDRQSDRVGAAHRRPSLATSGGSVPGRHERHASRPRPRVAYFGFGA
jgi:hypothetical protein